jgi:hypothetical protein
MCFIRVAQLCPVDVKGLTHQLFWCVLLHRYLFLHYIVHWLSLSYTPGNILGGCYIIVVFTTFFLYFH